MDILCVQISIVSPKFKHTINGSVIYVRGKLSYEVQVRTALIWSATKFLMSDLKDELNISNFCRTRLSTESDTAPISTPSNTGDAWDSLHIGINLPPKNIRGADKNDAAKRIYYVRTKRPQTSSLGRLYSLMKRLRQKIGLACTWARLKISYVAGGTNLHVHIPTRKRTTVASRKSRKR